MNLSQFLDGNSALRCPRETNFFVEGSIENHRIGLRLGVIDVACDTETRETV